MEGLACKKAEEGDPCQVSMISPLPEVDGGKYCVNCGPGRYSIAGKCVKGDGKGCLIRDLYGECDQCNVICPGSA